MYTVPEAGGIVHLQSQGESEAANPHRPVSQGFEPWTSGFVIQHSTPEPPFTTPLGLRLQQRNIIFVSVPSDTPPTPTSPLPSECPVRYR